MTVERVDRVVDAVMGVLLVVFGLRVAAPAFGHDVLAFGIGAGFVAIGAYLVQLRRVEL